MGEILQLANRVLPLSHAAKIQVRSLSPLFDHVLADETTNRLFQDCLR